MAVASHPALVAPRAASRRRAACAAAAAPSCAAASPAAPRCAPLQLQLQPLPFAARRPLLLSSAPAPARRAEVSRCRAAPVAAAAAAAAEPAPDAPKASTFADTLYLGLLFGLWYAANIAFNIWCAPQRARRSWIGWRGVGPKRACARRAAAAAAVC